MSEWNAAGWAWLNERPPAIRALALRVPPWNLYRMKSSGQRVTIVSYDEMEDGTVACKVFVSAQFNEFLMFERQVYGISADDLEPCSTLAPPYVA